MNIQQTKVNKLTSLRLFVPSVRIATPKKTLEVRQLLLISRILISIFTIGLIGYTMDWIKKTLQKH